jgi:hypothetical protein
MVSDVDDLNALADRLTKLAEWYGSGPKYPREFEQGRQRIAADLRDAAAVLLALATKEQDQ